MIPEHLNLLGQLNVPIVVGSGDLLGVTSEANKNKIIEILCCLNWDDVGRRVQSLENMQKSPQGNRRATCSALPRSIGPSLKEIGALVAAAFPEEWHRVSKIRLSRRIGSEEPQNNRGRKARPHKLTPTSVPLPTPSSSHLPTSGIGTLEESKSGASTTVADNHEAQVVAESSGKNPINPAPLPASLVKAPNMSCGEAVTA